MAKKIKSFTVDEDVYNQLVTMFKKYNAKTSISMYLNSQVKYLLEQLEDLEKGLESKSCSVPMSYIIDETVKDSARSGKISDQSYDEMPVSELELVLQEWQDSYDADKEGIPYEYYEWIKRGGFVLSKDKKFLINKESGKRYISRGKAKLMEVREVKSKKYDKDYQG